MIERNQIEALLRIHGLCSTSPEGEILAVLADAKYTKEEIDLALTLLKESLQQQTSRIHGLHKIYRTDDGLAPNEVSALLGVSINVTPLEIRHHRERRLSGGQNFIVLAIALVFALSGILYAMYEHQTGPFHPSVDRTEW
jgi:hypothetical protein